MVGESVVRQYRMVVGRITLAMRKMKRTKWWKLKKEEGSVAFREELRQALGGQEVLSDDWMTTADVVRETGKRGVGVSSGRKADKETWWWKEEVQEHVQRKRPP